MAFWDFLWVVVLYVVARMLKTLWTNSLDELKLAVWVVNALWINRMGELVDWLVGWLSKALACSVDHFHISTTPPLAYLFLAKS